MRPLPPAYYLNGLKLGAGPAIAFHWLIALLIFVTFPLGLYMQDLFLSPDKLKLYSWHKWIVVTVFMLASLRLFWRISHKPPPLISVSRWKRLASRVVHLLLCILILAILLSGWLMSSAKGFQTIWFGILPLPDMVGKDKPLGDLLTTVHKTLNFTMLALIFLHVSGLTLKHSLRPGLFPRALKRWGAVAMR